MSSTWETPGAGPRPRRLRGDAEAVSPGASRRERASARVLRLVDEQLIEQRAYEQAQPAAVGWKVAGLTVDADGLFAFFLFLPLLFIAQLGPAGAAMVAALTPLYVYVRRERLMSVMLPRLFLFLVPAFALFSVIWSEAPKETFKAAIELGLSVMAGILISSARNQFAVLKGLCAAFLVYVAAAVALGGQVAIGVGAGGFAFSGLSGSKNLLADIASTGLIIATAVIMLGVRRRQPLWVLIGAGAVMIDLYVVGAARSAGALVGIAMGAGAMISLSLLMLTHRAVRAWLTGAVAICLLAAGLSYRWLTQELIEMGARIFDKDPTLTGRTYLWYRASDLIQEKPMLGRGYDAFWIQGNIDAEGLWRYFGIDERGGFTFHNTAVELLVTLGWVGLILTAAVALVGAVFLVRKFVERPSIALVCWISLFLYQFARTPIETIGIAPFYFSTVLAFAALGAAFGRVKPARTRAPYRPALATAPMDYARATPGQLRLLRPGEP